VRVSRVSIPIPTNAGSKNIEQQQKKEKEKSERWEMNGWARQVRKK
jgi:ribosomal protein S10